MTSRLDAHKPEAHRDHSWKYPVRAATSSNGNFTTSFAAGQGLDGVTLVFGDRILIKDQSTGTVTIGSTALTFAEISSSGGISYATPSISLGSAAAAGAATTVIRSDSTIAAFDTTVPTMITSGASAATGSAAFAARRDHVH